MLAVSLHRLPPAADPPRTTAPSWAASVVLVCVCVLILVLIVSMIVAIGRLAVLVPRTLELNGYVQDVGDWLARWRGRRPGRGA